jgi:hypothetical protein
VFCREEQGDEKTKGFGGRGFDKNRRRHLEQWGREQLRLRKAGSQKRQPLPCALRAVKWRESQLSKNLGGTIFLAA